MEDKKALAGLLVLLQESKLPFEDVRLTGNLFKSYHDDAGNLIGSGDWNYTDLIILSVR